MKRIIPFLVLAAAIVSGCGDDTADAPTGGTSTLSGVVESVNSGPVMLGAVPGVTITLIGTNSDGDTFELQTTAGPGGAFIFEELVAGDYTLVLSYVDGNGNEVDGSVRIRIPDGKHMDVAVSLLGGNVTISFAESDSELVRVYYCRDGQTRSMRISRELYDLYPSLYSLAPLDCGPPAPPVVQVVTSLVQMVPQLDQSQLSRMDGLPIGTNWVAAQTFTAGMTAPLLSIRADISRIVTDPGPWNDITVQITTAPGGDPNGGVVLGTTTIGLVDVGVGLESIAFSPSIPLTAGTMYAIRINAPTSGKWSYVWVIENHIDPYFSGDIYSTKGVGTFSFYGGDAVFQTYMGVPAP